MVKAEKAELENKDTIAYWSALGGVEVKQIDYTPDGVMFYVIANAWNGKHSYHKCKLLEHRTTDGNHKDHITVRGVRLYLYDCLRA